MIKKIVIRDEGSFNKVGVTFDSLQKVNIVYGGNGTGKTTTSRVLKYGYAQSGVGLPDGLIMVKPWNHLSCEVYWEGEPELVLVYNKDFKEKCLKRNHNGLLVLASEPGREEEKIGVVEKALTDKINHEDQALMDRLWNEVYKPNKHNRELLKGYNRKELFFKKVKDLHRMKSVDKDACMEVGDFWHKILAESETLLVEEETGLAAMKAALHECQNAQIGNKSFYALQSDIDSINETLRLHGFSYLHFLLSPNEDGELMIQSLKGALVNYELSEGETTIITFLYFMQMVERHLQDNMNGGRIVVVIDDPISSLDYATTELVSTRTNDIIKKARKGQAEKGGGISQVIVLTHNEAYLKNISVNQASKNTQYWKLYKEDGISKLTACGNANPMTGYYESLWKGIRVGEGKMEVQRLMRRIIDTYFLGYGGLDRDKFLAGEYIKVQCDEKTMLSNAKWFEELYKEHRQNIVLGEYIQELYMKEFQMFFKLMGHEAHYNMMMRKD